MPDVRDDNLASFIQSLLRSPQNRLEPKYAHFHSQPSPPDNHNNPNIEDFIDRVELGRVYRGENNVLDVGFKNSLAPDNRSSFEVNWAFPLAQHLRGYVQLFTGYGENMIDMGNNDTRIGIGVALTDWL